MPQHLWERVFEWRRQAGGIQLLKLEAKDSLIDKFHKSHRCQGVLVACDETAFGEDSSFSPGAVVMQCFDLQVPEKPDAKPAVGIVFWPPPRPVPWARVLPCTLDKLSLIDGDKPEEGESQDNIRVFFENVRSVAVQ